MVMDVATKQAQLRRAREQMMQQHQSSSAGGGALTAEQQRILDHLEELHLKHYALEGEYRKEYCALRLKYLKMFKPLYEQRAAYLAPAPAKGGEDEGEGGGEGATGENKNVTSAETAVSASGAAALGTNNFPLPHFWLEALRNHTTFSHSVEPHDWPVLRYLVDITADYLDEQKQDCFKVTMKFAKNPFFKNTELSKTFIMHDDPESGEPMLVQSLGTKINWRPGKDVTTKIITKKQRNKKTDEVRTISLKRNRASLFHFFDSHEFPTDEQLAAMDEKEIQELESHFAVEYELGQILKDRIIPRALGWYLDIEVDSDVSEGEDEEEDEEDEDEDDDEDEEGGNARPRRTDDSDLDEEDEEDDDDDDDDDEDDDDEDYEDEDDDDEEGGATASRRVDRH